ncbi:hypothetical protein, partial [Micromonospora aurantiaca (nom. illeg.)]|uniref:hypothetical protein n=1 Tax=Micromonospora aurantiaca (nom. illeg.) TaxID=47850 RepID=UPI003EBF6C3C
MPDGLISAVRHGFAASAKSGATTASNANGLRLSALRTADASPADETDWTAHLDLLGEHPMSLTSALVDHRHGFLLLDGQVVDQRIVQIISVADVQYERLVLRVPQRLKHATKLPLTVAMY